MIQEEKCIGTIAYMGGIMAVPEPFAWSWSEMREFSRQTLCQPGEYIHAMRSKVSLHSTARNFLADNMRGDWLLMLDTDMEFDPDLCARMVRAMEVFKLDVLTGVYCFKNSPHTPVLYHWNEEKEHTELIGSWEKEAEFFEIGAAGGGCLLIRRKVFYMIKGILGERPFDHLPASEAHYWKGATHGEDHSFFRRLHKLDIKAYCACRIHSYHLRFDGIDPEYRAVLPERMQKTVELPGKVA